jgi:predicted  nucleic acid-binding Zn-ribbon protein
LFVVEQEIKENNEGFKEIEREDKRINEILEKRNEIEDDIEQKSRSLKLKEELVSKTKEMLEEDLTSKMSKRELQSMLNDFDYQIKEQKEEKDVLSHELFKLDRDISDIIKQESQLQSKIGRFQAEKDAQTQRQAARWEKIMACDEAFHLKSVLTGQSLTQQSQTQNTSYHASSLGDLSLTINSQRSSQQTHQLEIPKNDVDEFFRLVKKKKSELEDDMSDKRRQTKRNEDEIMNQISELTGTLKSIEKERSRLKQANQEKAIELADINKKTQGMPRMRKNDIEKAQENATKFAADRDKANNDPRRSHIPTEIRSLEEKIDGKLFSSFVWWRLVLFPMCTDT